MSLIVGFPKYYEKWNEITNLRQAIEKLTNGRIMILNNHVLALKIAGKVVQYRQCIKCPMEDIVHLYIQWQKTAAQA